MTTTPSPAAIAERYIATWNETDPQRRQALIAEGWTEDARYLDPMAGASGRAELEALIGAVQQRFPGLRFDLLGAPDGHNGRMRFSWSLGPAGGEPVACGTDFAVLAADGRFASVTGFLDRVPA